MTSAAGGNGRPTAQQVALDHLRRRISDGTLAPDERIRQERIAEEIAASVVPVREALKTLEAEGQVRYVPHRGYQVRRLGLAELLETYHLRQLLEDDAIRQACPHFDDGLFEALEAEMATMETAAREVDLVAMAEANRRFHFLLYERSGMPRMTDFIRQLWQSTDAYRARYYAEPGHRDRVNEEHRQIVAALRAGAVEEAIALLRRHRDAAVDSLRRVVEPEESAS
ncbi:GntR family transcriptional regulator [Nocardioides sp. GY 10113]|uniref:GntR family transcriptional regulator n=1 Tax=Nocardioides sp. GY 10113 TaxID=2569761 RepID=UPI0010A78D42|nr:GntR family transcriptional regulator [Nocardioides sp. GY 10113]TIC83234.1 GntR family transcriptional regulator [Nocardioides sp. GY 10113]